MKVGTMGVGRQLGHGGGAIMNRMQSKFLKEERGPSLEPYPIVTPISDSHSPELRGKVFSCL